MAARDLHGFVAERADPRARRGGELLELGIEAKASTPAEIAGRLNDDIKKWGAVIEAANIPKQ
ncbi:MAG: hypothetical protein NT062_18010 [Proteobacteria bacterium]|nr:hypothetical protein [Pseudomonadota bacterium]